MGDDSRSLRNESLRERVDPKYRYGDQTGTAFESWQTNLRAELRETLGFPAIRKPGVFRSRHHTTESTAGHERQHWTVRTAHGVRIPLYLLLPTDSDPPYSVVFAIHGHCEQGKELSIGRSEGEAGRIADERRDIARQAVERGHAAIAPDMRGFGELTPETDDQGGCRTLQMHAQLFGRSLLGDRTWDVLKLLDFVEERDELDADRVGITGHSGGSAVALLAGALDERFTAVASCCYFCTFEASLLARDHCVCNYVPGLARLAGVADIGGLVADRPLRIVAGEADSLFPIAGVRRAFADLRAIYRSRHHEDRCSLHVGHGGHRFYPEGVWPFLETRL